MITETQILGKTKAMHTGDKFSIAFTNGRFLKVQLRQWQQSWIMKMQLSLSKGSKSLLWDSKNLLWTLLWNAQWQMVSNINFAYITMQNLQAFIKYKATLIRLFSRENLLNFLGLCMKCTFNYLLHYSDLYILFSLVYTKFAVIDHLCTVLQRTERWIVPDFFPQGVPLPLLYELVANLCNAWE